MATEDGTFDETKVSEGGMVTIPAEIRARLDIQSGDKLRWKVDDEGDLSVEVVHQRYGAFDDFEAAPMGGDARETHNLAGHSRTVDDERPGDEDA